MRPEELELGRKLAAVFFPYALRRDEEFETANSRLVHYTSADNAMKILSGRQLWLRSTTCMNDFAEVNYGVRHLQQFFHAHFNDFATALGKDIAEEVVSEFDNANVLEATYVCSLSEHHPSENAHGRLSMWRAYGNVAGSAALVLKRPVAGSASGLGIILSPVAYFTFEDVERELLNVVANIQRNADFLTTLDRRVVVGAASTTLIAAAISLKHPGFAEEKEWRIVHTPMLRRRSNMKFETETIAGLPQRVYKLRLENDVANEVSGVDLSELVDRVIIGPTSFPGILYDAFVDVLVRAKVPDAPARVVRSEIPLRR